MKIEKAADGCYVLVVCQKELDELRCGLGWSFSEGCHLDDTINRELHDQLKEYETKE